MSTIKKRIKQSIKATLHPRDTKRQLIDGVARRSNNQARREQYLQWFADYEATIDTIAEREDIKKWKYQPLISVLIPTYNTQPDHLRECLDSVLSQSYQNWEICISDDASPDEETKKVIREYVKKYSNIHATFSKANGHIAVSSNIALGMAKGEFVSLLDHDDLLLPNALYETVKMISMHPDADLIYSDEDKLEDDKYHVEPFFKPDWSPNFLNSCNYITHFSTIRTSVMKDIGGFTPGTQGAQDWDLLLRITQQTQGIYHIPKIIYTWRKSATSTAASADSKPYAYINQKRVLRDSVKARGENAYIESHPALGFWRKRYVIEGLPLVSIIVPTIDSPGLIKGCIDSIIEKSTYPNFEIIIVDTGSSNEETLLYYESLIGKNLPVEIVNYTKKFNFSSACNLGAEKSNGEYLLFLNNDTEVITADWIQGLLEHAQRDEVGMVGAKLLFPNENIQHAGVVLSERDIAFHPFYNTRPDLDIFTYIYANNLRDVSAVTAACSMVAASKFNQVGGFDDKLRVTYNDVDLNLKLLQASYRNIYNPFVELFHFESISVGNINTSNRDKQELKEASRLMRNRWNDYLKRDVYYNDNFQQKGPGYRL